MCQAPAAHANHSQARHSLVWPARWFLTETSAAGINTAATAIATTANRLPGTYT